jgi:hypothetical protein
VSRELYLHRNHGYVGWLDGTTRLHHLFEDPADDEEPRVRLPDGSVRVASLRRLLRLDTPEAVLKAHRWLLRRLWRRHPLAPPDDGVQLLDRVPQALGRRTPRDSLLL